MLPVGVENEPTKGSRPPKGQAGYVQNSCVMNDDKSGVKVTGDFLTGSFGGFAWLLARYSTNTKRGLGKTDH